ncbi:hypothetical protein [Corynebacterium nuruki]|uniref:hypothetical protein n=1 Tax=Corynebacterium nuruki TaxID=1032851 RepID=UPI0039BFCEDC
MSDQDQHDQTDQQATPEQEGQTSDPTPAEDHTTDQTEDQATEEHTEEGKAGNVDEARKYRKRAQAAEKERDQARAQLDALRLQLVTEEASRQHRVNPELFNAAGIDTSTLFTEEGALDHTRLADTCADIRTRFGIPEQKKYRDNPLQGTPARERSTTWQDALFNGQ